MLGALCQEGAPCCWVGVMTSAVAMVRGPGGLCRVGGPRAGAGALMIQSTACAWHGTARLLGMARHGTARLLVRCACSPAPPSHTAPPTPALPLSPSLPPAPVQAPPPQRSLCQAVTQCWYEPCATHGCDRGELCLDGAQSCTFPGSEPCISVCVPRTAVLG